MNVQNTLRSLDPAGGMGGTVDPALGVGLSAASATASSLTICAGAEATEAVQGVGAVCAEDALATDGLDRLIKDVLSFSPPPLPNFDIIRPENE